LCGTLSARDDGASVAHAATRGRSNARNERGNGLGAVCSNEFGCILLGSTTDLANQ
jgi:hypothetical protein